jgi:hypothetical protein
MTGRIPDRIAWIILAAALAFSVFVRWRLAEFPLERDEGEYAYAGQLILQGIPPYSLAYNMKLPGTYLAYAGLMAVFGQTDTGIHLGLLTVNLVAIGLIFFFARELFDSMTGAVAAASFSVLSASYSVLGFAAHATHFVALFGVAGVWILWRAIRLDKILLFLAAGVLLGIAFLMKQQGVFLPCFGCLAVMFFCLRQRPIFSRRHFAICLIYIAGVVFPYIVICLWIWRAGTFDKFWFWTVQYAQMYIEEIPLSYAYQYFWFHIKNVLEASWPLWALAVVGTFGLAHSRDVPGRRTFVFMFLAFSFFCVCPGFIFREHYFIVLLPCLAILAGVGAVTLMDVIPRFVFAKSFATSPHGQSYSHRRSHTKAAAVNPDGIRRGFLIGFAALIPAVAIVLPVWQQQDYFFFWSPDEACRQIYIDHPFVECRTIADYLKNHSRPGDRVAVIGSEPEIYFYSRRISATGYIYMYPLMELHPFARTMQKELISQIESVKPEFLVFVKIRTSWSINTRHSDTYILKWSKLYVEHDYYPVGLVDIQSNKPTEYKWDALVAGAQPHSSSYIWIFRRKH